MHRILSEAHLRSRNPAISRGILSGLPSQLGGIGFDQETGSAPSDVPLPEIPQGASRQGTDTSGHSISRPRTSKKITPPNRTVVNGPIQMLRFILLSNYANPLLIFVPIGIALHFTNVSASVIFVMNFLAIIPLAALLSLATEGKLYIAISIKVVGQTLGGLMNATFGNAVELIVSIIALVKGEIGIVQASLLGSMLSNLLLVLGMAFFFGGLKKPEQKFNMTVAQTSSSLLTISIISLLIPAAFHFSVPDSDHGVSQISRAVSILLLITYSIYLWFQVCSTSVAGAYCKLKSHAYLYDVSEEYEIEEHATLPVSIAVLVLIVVTVLVAVCAEFLVASIDSLVSNSSINRKFVGLILLPIVGNAAEHVTAVTLAIKDKVDLSIAVAVGSSAQVSLLVTPLMVILGWIIGKDMTLFFDPFQTVVLFASILLVNYIIQDGKSNYLEGSMLVTAYIIIAIAVWYYPKDSS
ncbi:Vacuolar calcium ion transporter [Neolecta irregularis DAH-3]|uniref:Vacuolar calcium ion transporter n=1 Tax=Neolecta irregularis (strain DAH-3) TaxID=1198029 RepID=A0A1U7LGU0_NEOID|nr:Vacuolar calcium ion transporter [Neolecta irregularis DAH-3]|eukprot:OLL21813.1 Vacuolar calcium ion transporter [Neolecta irregularis DAH-3]